MIGKIPGGNQRQEGLNSRPLQGSTGSRIAAGDEWTKDYVKEGDLVDTSLHIDNSFKEDYGHMVFQNSLISFIGGSVGLGFFGYIAAMAASFNPILGVALGIGAAAAFVFKRDASEYGTKELTINGETREKTRFAGMEPMSRLELNAMMSAEMGTKKETDQKFVLDCKDMDRILSRFDTVSDTDIEKYSDCRELLIKLEQEKRLLAHTGLKTPKGKKIMSLITAVDAVNFLASGKGISVVSAGEKERSGYEFGIHVKRADMRSYENEDGHRNISSTEYKLETIKNRDELRQVREGQGLPPGVVGVNPDNNTLVTSDGFKIVGHSLRYRFDGDLGFVVRTETNSSTSSSIT